MRALQQIHHEVVDTVINYADRQICPSRGLPLSCDWLAKSGRGMQSKTHPFAKQHLGRILYQHGYQSSQGPANQRLRYARYAAAPAESVDAPVIRTRVRGERVATLFGVGEVNVTADRARRRTV